jgi:hypothetical protein
LRRDAPASHGAIGRNASATLSVSDNGYVFPANEAVIREARKAARGLHHQH